MGTKLYVGNLSYETSETDLKALFEAAGSVSTVALVRDRSTGQPRGFAFVEMADEVSARRAITQLDKHDLGGRNLIVNEAKPLIARGAGFGRQGRDSRW